LGFVFNGRFDEKQRETTNGNTAYKAVAGKYKIETMNKEITILR